MKTKATILEKNFIIKNEIFICWYKGYLCLDKLSEEIKKKKLNKAYMYVCVH